MERRELRSRHGSSDADHPELAERLDRLTVGEVDRVLHRAIELEAGRTVGVEPDLFDLASVARIADELGIDRASLQRAIDEELARVVDEPEGWLDRLIAPERLVARRMVGLTRPEIRRALDVWLEDHEGLRKRAEGPSGARWERDPRLVTAARMALRTGHGSGRLRGALGVEDRVREIATDRRLVTLEADTSNARARFAALAGVGALAGGAAAAALGVVDPGGFGLDEVALGAATFAAVGGGAWLGIRLWIRQLREALERAADAVAHPALVDGDTTPQRLRRAWEAWRELTSGSGRRGGR